MLRHVAESWVLLLYFDWLMHFRGFQEIHTAVRNSPPRAVGSTAPDDGELSRAVDLACVFYFKPVLCLQRSAAATVQLRRCGWNAEMVIGAQLLPFQSHAWVEIDGRVINDKPYITEIFQVLERC
ncbi:lasso peptide biosynthesis B2 protein [Granulicella sibirica]|nr:lasso peptide biosynthesis B2 protein [Granulicella sibirica]